MDIVKYITEELRKPPFRKDFNLASFECMSRDELIQIFNDVLAQLEPSQHVQIVHEELLESVERIMEFLRVLKYKPSIDEPQKHRDAIYNGETEIILPVMGWILERAELLKTRAYLSKFLVEVELPVECLTDDEISETNQKYLALIEEFKSVHKQHEKAKMGKNTYGLASDMQNIEHDLECIHRKIEIAKSKYRGYSDLQSVLTQAGLIRKARDKLNELRKQSHQEELKLREAEDKFLLSRRLFKDLKEKNNGGRTAEGVVEFLEENCEVLKYIVLEKIPREVDSNERCITAMKRVQSDPPSSQQDLSNLNMKITLAKKELYALETRILRKLHHGDLQQIREQSEQVEKIRQLKATKLSCINREQYMQKKLLEHRAMESSSKRESHLAAGEVSDEQYCLFMKQMRLKVTKYKQMRSEIARLQNEAGILASTKFIMGGELRETAETLATIERSLGILGFSDAQEKLENISSEKALLDESNKTTLYEMACMSKDLHDKIALKKLHLEPLIKELQAKRLSSQLLEVDHNKLKDQYQSTLTTTELDTCHHQTKRDQLLAVEMRLNRDFGRLVTEISIMQANLERAKNELKFEGLHIGKENKSRGFKDKLLAKILEEERRNKELKEENGTITETCAQRRRHSESWAELKRLLKAKIEVRMMMTGF